MPEALKQDPELWSGCIAGAFQKDVFLQAFEAAGFADVSYDKWDDQPWRVIDGLAFHSATVCAHKPGAGAKSPGCCG